jgi:hypothetical protein
MLAKILSAGALALLLSGGALAYIPQQHNRRAARESTGNSPDDRNSTRQDFGSRNEPAWPSSAAYRNADLSGYTRRRAGEGYGSRSSGRRKGRARSLGGTTSTPTTAPAATAT